MSKIEIINKALTKLGANRIKTLNDDTLEARAANEVYDYALNSVLSETDWTFAIKRQMLKESNGKTPPWGEGKYFILPPDLVKIVDVMDRNIKWHREGDYIFTHASKFGLVYIAKFVDPTFYPPYFIDALVAKLAAELCYLITNSASETNNLIDLYEGQILPVAKTKNAREKSSPIIEDSFWVNSTLRSYWG